MRHAAWICAGLSMLGCGDDASGVADAAIDAAPGIALDIEFMPLNTLPSGSWLLANDWADDPNTAFVIPTSDLAGARRDLFSANRIWAMGGAEDGSAIWFSAFDDAQQMHFGLTIGDSIQNTFAYDPASQTVRALSPAMWMNVNDECHAPSRDGKSIYVCRRYDFTQAGAFFGWRIVRITLATGAFEFVRLGDGSGPHELAPQELPGNKLLFEMRQKPPASGASIHMRDLASGTEQMIRNAARKPVVAPDGHRVLFVDTASRRFKTLDLDNPAAAPVDVSTTLDPGSAAWSPDGNTIVYTVFDQQNSCDHLERVTFAGTWSAPQRVRDCTITGEFSTDITWITVP